MSMLIRNSLEFLGGATARTVTWQERPEHPASPGFLALKANDMPNNATRRQVGAAYNLISKLINPQCLVHAECIKRHLR